MKFTKYTLIIIATATILFSCGGNEATSDSTEAIVEENDSNFVWKTEQFADLKIVRYKINGWENLSLQQKKLVYFLTQAGYSGRDMIWDQNYRHNLTIRRSLESIVNNYAGDKETEDWKNFMIYTKRVWFSAGIHHHYSNDKFTPEFSKEYFTTLMAESKAELADEIVEVIFNPEIDNKKVSLDPTKDLLLASAVNLYGPDVTEKEATEFYAAKVVKGDKEPIWHGLNSQLVKGENGLEERVYKSGGLYGEAIDEIIGWLEKAVGVAENEDQGNALKLLIEYYKTGDLNTWDDYNVAWCEATEGDIDYINSFIEVYNDPLGYGGSYESIVEINDFEASARMAVVAENAQWFEDNSTILDEHKKKEVVGVTYKVVEVAGESGDASPSSAIGVNLPNSPWIRKKHGSKSVSLGSIIHASSKAGGSGMLDEFCYTKKEIEMEKEHGAIGDKMHTALHEVIGHASGQINEGIGTPKETLKSYASAIEEARADLVGLYYLLDPKLVEMGLISSLDVGKTAYDGYIRNGMITQLMRLEPDAVIEESHMRNRQLVAAWAMEKGADDNVIEKIVKDGKTYFVVNDYEKLRTIFGELLMIIQKLTSEGDYQTGKDLVENYGVQVDAKLHAEVLARVKKLNIAPYGGFINPNLEPVTNATGEITDIKVSYPDDFTKQMLDYAKRFSFLPDNN
ncbi:MAG: dihydrofolate reductase [Flavobacteriales bacterium]|nr:MAG: dihydrofolate reductase [Flavobacteriales bacterium]